MIKPDTLWNLFKHADKETIGRVCMSLANRQNELETPLNSYELMFFNMIREAEEWMDEAVAAVKQRKHDWYEQKKQLKKLTPKNDLTSNASNASIDYPPSVRPSVRPSIHPSNILEEHISVQGGAGEGTDAEEGFVGHHVDDTGFKYPRSVLIRKCNAVHMADVLRPNEIEPFVEYLLTKRLCEQEANQTCSVQYIKSLARTWKSEGWNDHERHTVTYEELQEAVVAVNKTRTTKIDLATVNRFWDFLAPDFKHKNGDPVTKYTVGKTLKYWVDIEAENARKKEAEAEEERLREERHQQLLLTECDD